MSPERRQGATLLLYFAPQDTQAANAFLQELKLECTAEDVMP
jgi:hypothetical protein